MPGHEKAGDADDDPPPQQATGRPGSGAHQGHDQRCGDDAGSDQGRTGPAPSAVDDGEDDRRPEENRREGDGYGRPASTWLRQRLTAVGAEERHQGPREERCRQPEQQLHLGQGCGGGADRDAGGGQHLGGATRRQGAGRHDRHDDPDAEGRGAEPQRVPTDGGQRRWDVMVHTGDEGRDPGGEDEGPPRRTAAQQSVGDDDEEAHGREPPDLVPPARDHLQHRSTVRAGLPALAPTGSATRQCLVKGLILSGGAGTRLRPITHTGAKQLVPVANKPILFYGLEDLASAGIVEVGIVIGETGDEIRAAVGDGSQWGLEVTYIPQDEPLGLAHCVLIAGDFLGDEDFVMYLGDNLLRQGVAEFVRLFEADRDATRAADPASSHCAAQILLARVPDPQRFGVAAFAADGSVSGLVEKPAEPPSDLALVGVYLFDPSIHEAVRAIAPSARGELEITDAIQWLIDHGRRVRHEVLDGWWKDTGLLEPLLEGNRLVLEGLEPEVLGTVDAASRVEGRVSLGAGAEVVGSLVRGPTIIGSGVRIVNSYVGPFTSIGPDCVITDTEIEHSIVFADSRISGVPRIVDSLIGRSVVVAVSDRRPRATRLMLGDHSQVELDQ